jgi:NAD(P)-dependent dehydrogenase (short-subunit alcohol dehydrogenase family)
MSVRIILTRPPRILSEGCAGPHNQADVTDRAGYGAAADEGENVFGAAPDLLVLTAGVNVFGPAEASTYDDFDWVVGVCFGGVVNGLVTFVPRMIKKGAGGHIAATVSWGAFGAGPMTAPYSAAKAAVLNLLESYFVSLKPYGIGVTALCPANIRSRIYEAAIQGRPEQFKTRGSTSPRTLRRSWRNHERVMDPAFWRIGSRRGSKTSSSSTCRSQRA